MPVETVNLFLALLFAGAMVIVVIALVLGIVRLTTGALPDSVVPFVDEIRGLALPLAFVAPTVAMLGSLYYSEVVGYDPCRLCWVQRYFMYPSSILLGLALILKRPVLAWSAFGLSVLGAGVSIYHRAEQQWPDWFSDTCDPTNPCSGRWVETWGFVTIPTMAFAAFALVLIFVPLSLLRPKEAFK